MSPPPAAAPDPREIAAQLGRRVIGQQAAIQEMAIALAKKLGGLDTGNILLVGSSGTGKTTLMRAVEGYLDSRPELALRSTVIRMHANVLGEEARRGRPGEAVLSRLLERARDRLGVGTPVERLLEQARRGIVFIDEVDKIRSWVGSTVNTDGIRAQEALLTVMENEAFPLTLPAWAGGGSLNVDSSGLLFVCGGAFEGLYDAVYDRVTVGRDRGSLRPVTVVEDGRVDEKLIFHLGEWLRNEDLFDYGMSPQFLSRFDATILLHDLAIDDLVTIFLEMPESGYRQACAYFESRGYHLALSPTAVRRIAGEAAKQPRLGARALKEVFRRVIRDYEFDPAARINGPGGSILLDEREVVAALAD